MMKSILHKTTSLLMAILLLLSTTSWKVEKHYCMGHLMDVSLFINVDTCGMNMSITDNNEILDDVEDSCCNDEVIFVEGQDDLKISFDNLTFEQQQFVFSFAYSFVSLFEPTDENITPFRYYVPPPLLRDVQILDQTFLI